MTKKEELIKYVEDNIDTTKNLFTNVFYESIQENGVRIFGVISKERLLGHFKNDFNDDLIGSSRDGVIIHILDWTAQDKIVSQE
jgi:hypothetical protein